LQYICNVCLDKQPNIDVSLTTKFIRCAIVHLKPQKVRTKCS